METSSSIEPAARAGHGHFWDYDPNKVFPGEDHGLYATVTRDPDLARLIVGIAIPFQEDGLFLIDGWIDRDTELAMRTTVGDEHGHGHFERYLICTGLDQAA